MIQNKLRKLEAVILLVALAIAGFGIWQLGPSLTGFVIKQFSYSENLNLVVTSNGNYTWNPANIGELKSLKIDGKVTNSGKAKVYVESNGIKYLIFDSSRLNESADAAVSNQTSLITGFAVKGDNDDDEGKDNDKDKKKKNHKPEWDGTNSFTINGTTELNLSQYFTDKDEDALTFSASSGSDKLSALISGGIAALTPSSGNNFNTTVTFIASDWIGSASETVEIDAAVENTAQQNRAPVWNSDADTFAINGTTTIDLSGYFTDEDNDELSYNYGSAANITISVDNSLMTLVPADNYHGNATTIFTAFDGKDLAVKSVALVIPESISTTTIPANGTINQTPTNETNEAAQKIIAVNLSYNSGTVYDANDNGEESITGVVDLSAANTKFNWNADESKLCTRWEVYNTLDAALSTFCYGNSDCCAFIGLLPTKSNWSGVYYSTFGKDGAGYDNIVSAQVVYYDVNLSVPKSDIYNSGWGNLSVKFYNDETEFFGKCIDTCYLSGLNKSSYTLIFEIEDGATLRINKLKYTAAVDVRNNPPELVRNISRVNVNRNGNEAIGLSEYFNDKDGDLLNYNYYKADNITILFENNAAKIIPDKNIEGIRYTYITANDTELTAVSNVFMINISKEAFKPKVEIGKPVKWVTSIVVDVTNATSVNFSLPENALNVNVTILNQSSQQEIPDANVKVIEDGKIKSKDLFEDEGSLDAVKRKISILEEARQKDALSVEVDSDKFDNEELGSKLDSLYSRKAELEQKLSPAQANPITGNAVRSLITGNAVALTETEINSSLPTLFINESLAQNTEISIEYETEAPISIEDEINQYTKEIKIVSDTHYDDILSYTSLNDVPQNSIKLYWIQNNARVLFDKVNYYDENNNGLIDMIEWVVPHLSNQTFEVVINVLNVQSYPTVGGSWAVQFNTTGTGNLTISAVDGTTYSEYYDDTSITINDLDILELKCGNEILFNKNDLINANNIYLVDSNGNKLKLNDTINKSIKINSLYAENYNCDNLTGYWTVKVLTSGVHNQRFNFSDQIADAHNFASAIGGAFIVQDSAGASLAVIDSAGNMNIKGTLTQSAEPTAGTKDFVAQNSTGGLNLVITNPAGNLLIKNSLTQNQGTLSPTLSSLIIQNSTGAAVAYVNSTGGLFLTGSLTQNVLFG